ncbi:MAG: hypothetical protein ACAH80_18300 [Alphaproteobacteria bacterium]
MPDNDKPEPKLAEGQSRPLTAGEIELAKSVYGSSVDYSQVRVHRKPWLIVGQPETTAMSPDGHMHFPSAIYVDDFSKGDRGLFIHEMAHVWQKQNKITDPVLEGISLFFGNWGNYGNSYNHTVDPKKDLLDYNMEQQGRLIESYFAYLERRKDGPPMFKPADYDAIDKSPEAQAMLQRLSDIHKRDPDNKYLRNVTKQLGVQFNQYGDAYVLRISEEEQRRRWHKMHTEQAALDEPMLAVMRNFAADPLYMHKCPASPLPSEDSRVIATTPKTTGMG